MGTTKVAGNNHMLKWIPEMPHIIARPRQALRLFGQQNVIRGHQ